MKPLIKATNIHYTYIKGSKRKHVIRNVSFTIMPGETLGLVGESGCGKTTIANLLLNTLQPTEGTIEFDGIDLSKIDKKKLQEIRKNIQMVFQDPYSSVNPRMTVEEIIKEPLLIYKIGSQTTRSERIDELLTLVGLDRSFRNRYPHELSGGQRQRVVIARALATNPKFLVLDEPIAALDASIQAQIINLLKDLQKHLGLTYLFISHDLSIIKYFSDRLAVMYFGQIIEMGKSEEIYSNPLHPYTKGLLASIPLPDPLLEHKRKRLIIHGETPNFNNQIQGCPFASRCYKAIEICSYEKPTLSEEQGHLVSCHLSHTSSATPHDSMQQNSLL